jgi:Tol biopolymer transport system component
MEYVSGKTLDQLIHHKGLPLKQALKYALEIADALAAAHAAGIVHRDIKPGNIMVTEQGRVKVLDFGLAKLTEPVRAPDTSLPDPFHSMPGVIFGTAGYLSPEQAQGGHVDGRSDIFAFGALLYEMVTGRRAFPGDNAITVLSAVINQEPAPAASIVANLPREIEWVIERCLKKDPDRRIQHVIDVKIALEEAMERLDSPALAPVGVGTRWRTWLAPALIALLLVSATAAWLGQRMFRREPITYQRLTYRRGDILNARFAPNGTVVYSAEWDGAPPTVFSAQPGNREARDLGLPSANLQSVSPSGELAILIGSIETGAAGTLAKAPLAGGAPREILDDVWAADWGPDGKSLAVIRQVGGRYRLEYPIGNVLFESSAVRPPLYGRVSPRGDQVAFFDPSSVGDYSLSVVDTKRQRRVLSTGWRAVSGVDWSPSGRELWFCCSRTGAEAALYAVDLSGRERMLTQIAGWGLLHDVASDGRLLLANADTRIGIRGLAPGAKEERDLGWLDASVVYGISNDGKTILFGDPSSGEARNMAIYLRHTDGSPAVRLGYGNRPSLSADGKWVACVRSEGESARLVLLPTGTGEERVLSTGAIQPQTVEWFADGKRLLFSGGERGQPAQTYVLELAGGQPKAVTAAGIRATGVSPDGRFAVVIGSGKLRLQALDGGHESAVAAVDPAVSVIRWSEDGRFLFLQRMQPEARSAAVLRMDVHTGRTEVWRELRAPDPGAFFRGLARLSSDGQAYAFSYQRDLSTLFIVKGVR